jgi:hypothetical protein
MPHDRPFKNREGKARGKDEARPMRGLDKTGRINK